MNMHGGVAEKTSAEGVIVAEGASAKRQRRHELCLRYVSFMTSSHIIIILTARRYNIMLSSSLSL